MIHGKPKSEMGEDLADIVAAGAEDRKDGVSGGALQCASAEAAICFHMTDFGLSHSSPDRARQW